MLLESFVSLPLELVTKPMPHLCCQEDKILLRAVRFKERPGVCVHLVGLTQRAGCPVELSSDADVQSWGHQRQEASGGITHPITADDSCLDTLVNCHQVEYVARAH